MGGKRRWCGAGRAEAVEWSKWKVSRQVSAVMALVLPEVFLHTRAFPSAPSQELRAEGSFLSTLAPSCLPQKSTPDKQGAWAESDSCRMQESREAARERKSIWPECVQPSTKSGGSCRHKNYICAGRPELSQAPRHRCCSSCEKRSCPSRGSAGILPLTPLFMTWHGMGQQTRARSSAACSLSEA